MFIHAKIALVFRDRYIYHKLEMMLDFILLYRRVHRSTLQVSNEIRNKSDQLYLFVTVLEKVEKYSTNRLRTVYHASKKTKLAKEKRGGVGAARSPGSE